ncbi:MAG: CAP domain-containing protein [Bacteroidia bacterium]
MGRISVFSTLTLLPFFVFSQVFENYKSELKKGDRFLEQKKYDKAEISYKNALKQSSSNSKNKSEVYYKLSKLHFFSFSNALDLHSLGESLRTLSLSKKYNKNDFDDRDKHELKIIEKARLIIDTTKIDLIWLSSLSEQLYKLTGDNFDTMIHDYIANSEYFEYGSFNHFFDYLAKCYNNPEYKIRIDYLIQKSAYQAYLKSDYFVVNEIDIALSNKNVTASINKHLKICYDYDFKKVNYDTIDNNIDNFTFGKHIAARNELLKRGVVKEEISDSTRYMALCLLKNSLNKENIYFENHPFWIFEHEFKNYLPNKETTITYSANLFGQEELYHTKKLTKGELEFNKLLLLFIYDKDTRKVSKHFNDVFFKEFSEEQSSAKMLLEFSKIDVNILVDFLSYTKFNFISEYYKNEFADVFKSLNSVLIKGLSEDNSENIAKVITVLCRNDIKLSSQTNQKLKDYYRKKLKTLKKESDYSEAYIMYAGLIYNNPNDASLINSKKELITLDYENNYLRSLLKDEDLEWTGDFDRCDAGKMPNSFYEKQLLRLKFFRRITDLPDNLFFDDELNDLAQHAALANSFFGLSHNITKDMKCYSKKAAIGSSESNLSTGIGMDGYIEDPGSHNKGVGHRRWILNPKNSKFGVGATYKSYKKKSEYGDWWLETNQMGHALHVFASDDNGALHNKDYSQNGVAYPNEGYFPKEFIYQRWSYSLDYADFKKAKVTMRIDDKITVYPIVYDPEKGYGLNTLAWEYDMDYDNTPKKIEVTITNVKKNGDDAYTTIKYTVYPFSLDKDDLVKAE